MITKITELLASVRASVPLVHCITNYVTVNDCANALLAIGGSPIMADDAQEIEDITALAGALVINLGTLNERTVGLMLAAGKRANALNRPIVFDPVGAGASSFRNSVTVHILTTLKVSIIRGNLSELAYIAGQTSSTKGVDVSPADKLKDGAEVAREVAKRVHCVAALTGSRDTVTDGERTVNILNDTPLLEKVTGTGCMISAISGAFAAAAAGGDMLIAGLAGVAAMNIAGEIAAEKTGAQGLGSFHQAIINELGHLDGTAIAARLRLS